MRPMLSLIAVLAISGVVPVFAASNRFARDVETPQVDAKSFLEEADVLLRNVLTNYTLLIAENSDNLRGLGDELKNCSYLASLVSSQNSNNVELQHAAKQIRDAGGLLRLGNRAGGFVANYYNEQMKLAVMHYYSIPFWSDDEYIIALSTVRNSLFSYKSFPEFNYYWQMWMADRRKTYFSVETIQEFAKQYNMTAAEFWYPNYSETIMAELENVMQQLKPFYEKLHAFVRHDLFRIHGAGVQKPKGPIPYHLLQRVMHTAWSYESKDTGEIFDYVLPAYNDKLAEGNLTAEKLLRTADEFYRSLGFDALPKDVWEHNIFEADECPGFVTDNSMNTTLEYCGRKTPQFKDFAELHALMGRLHAAMLKKQLPAFYFAGYTLGTPVGNAVKLAATTPKHLNLLNLIKEEKEFSEKQYLLRNFYMALEEIFSIPIAYVEARVVIDFMNEKVKKSELNQLYWSLLEQYAGVEPWADREELSLDLPFSVTLGLYKQINIINVVRDKILGFQFYKAFCQQAGYVGALDNCDFYGSTEVGGALKKMLSLGSSKPFSEVVVPVLKSQQKLDGSAILDYFKPTEKWLDIWVKASNISVGWEHTTKNLSMQPNKESVDAKSSDTIYQLYDQIASQLFAKEEKPEFHEYDDSAGVEMKFWKHLDSSVAARPLQDIALAAQQIDTSLFIKRKRNAVLRLCKISDIFSMAEEMEDGSISKNGLASLATEKDIPKYKGEEEEEISLIDIRDIILHSRDAEELKYYWQTWRERNSGWAKQIFLETLTKVEKSAELLELPVDEFWFNQYSPSVLKKLEKHIEGLRPLYRDLHSYVKKALIDRYGSAHLSNLNDAIPDHLLEQVLLQIWTKDSIVEKHFPFADLPPTDQAIAEGNYSALDLLRKAEDFYTSLGFEPIEEDFWQNRLRAQDGVGNQSDCHETIYDMTPKVYMKYCDKVSYKKLLQAHGYMGRIHYAAEKKGLPVYDFDSYLLEYAVGKAVILSASSPTHLQKIGLVPNIKFTEEVLMNRHIRMGIDTLFKLHKYFVHTKVVTEYLQEKIPIQDINEYYWKYMMKYASIAPPSERSSQHFDFPYDFYADLEQNHQLKKFIVELLSYPIHKALCRKSRSEGDLMTCDFYGSEGVGDALKEMMKLGSSAPRSNTLTKLSIYYEPSSIYLEQYYRPLYLWLNKPLSSKRDDFSIKPAKGKDFSSNKFLKLIYDFSSNKLLKLMYVCICLSTCFISVFLLNFTLFYKKRYTHIVRL